MVHMLRAWVSKSKFCGRGFPRGSSTRDRVMYITDADEDIATGSGNGWMGGGMDGYLRFEIPITPVDC